ncbi:hypothetical protein [Gluconobacter morbifer]|uniref:Uncharacterized protein n=1 Tax=Gluconobacter morbifer G707 TaxID=1088869 RepID=G6XJV0_9PROT|nr:hypothetical protein [Gluconobacter morbifer]EHH67912.1 hypothetical protein GMO_16790 [Gluconobacter morbifer G707]
MGERRSRSAALPFPALPVQRKDRPPVSSRPQPPASSSQPDLLDWQPPQTHLPAADVEACLLEPSGFRPPSGEAFLYALVEMAQGEGCLRDGLALADETVFLDGMRLAADLAASSPEQDVRILRVRRRLILPWLRPYGPKGQKCYVLVFQAGTIR